MSKFCMAALVLVLLGTSISFAFEPVAGGSPYAGDRFAAPPPSGLRFSGYYGATPQVLTSSGSGMPITNDGFPGYGGPGYSGAYYGGGQGGSYGSGQGCKACGNACGGGTCGPGVGPCVHWSYLPWVSPSWGGHEGLRYVDVTNYWY